MMFLRTRSLGKHYIGVLSAPLEGNHTVLRTENYVSCNHAEGY